VTHQREFICEMSNQNMKGETRININLLVTMSGRISFCHIFLSTPKDDCYDRYSRAQTVKCHIYLVGAVISYMYTGTINL
jgi:hypothetical protein